MNWKNVRCRDSMIYDNVHEKSPKKPRTRKCTRFFGANMVLCGTIKHHNKTSNQCFTALWHVLELCKLMGYASSLSAINIENQWFAKFVHENVHETPDFTPISGVFYVFSAMVIVYNKNKMKPGDKTGLRHCSPAMNRGFRNNVGAKVLILFQNLSQCGKNVA